jgi:hypothetical protein
MIRSVARLAFGLVSVGLELKGLFSCCFFFEFRIGKFRGPPTIMSELNEEILMYLDANDNLDTLKYAKSHGLDHQKVVGTVKSLQSQSQDVGVFMCTATYYRLKTLIF